MNKEFVNYEIALELKELGFDEPCFAKYNSDKLLLNINWNNIWCENINKFEIYAPTFSQAFRFFREKHGLPNHIDTYWQHDWNNYSYQWSITENHEAWNCIEHYKTYEQVENACLIKLIEIVKNK